MGKDDNRWVVALLRVSSTDQKRGHSLVGQKLTIERYATEHGDEIDKFYDEQSRSAYKNVPRPEFDKMVEDIKNNKIKKIYVWRGDRLTRNIFLNETLHALFLKYKVTLISLTEDINYMTADGRNTERKRAVDRQGESEKTSERTCMGLMASAYSGNYPKAKPKLGWKWKNGFSPSPIEIDEEIYPEVMTIINKALHEKVGVPNLMKWLNANKFLNRKWSENTLYSWLEDPILCGTFVNRLKNPTIIIKGHSPALITEEEFQLLQQLIHQRYRTRRFTYLFKGFLECKCCGGILKVQPAHNHQGIIYLYHYCKTCNKRINETVIYEELKSQLEGMTLTKESQDLIGHLEIKQKRIVKTLKDYYQLYINDEITETQYSEQIIELQESLQLLKLQIDSLKDTGKVKFDQLALTEQRKILGNNIDRILIEWNPKKITAIKKQK